MSKTTNPKIYVAKRYIRSFIEDEEPSRLITVGYYDSYEKALQALNRKIDRDINDYFDYETEEERKELKQDVQARNSKLNFDGTPILYKLDGGDSRWYYFIAKRQLNVEQSE